MNIRHQGLPATCVATVLLMIATGAALAAEPSAASVAELLQEVGLRISHRVELARLGAEEGRLHQELLRRHAEQATAAVVGLERELALLPPEEAEPLRAKLEAIRAEADNLARAAELEGSAPPRPPRVTDHVRHLGRRHGAAESPPANDDCANAIDVTLGTYAGSTAEATNDGEASCGASLSSPDIWFRLTVPTSQIVVVDTVGSSYDTVLSVHSGCPGTLSNQIECNDDHIGLQSAVSFIAYAGDEYLIRVSGFNQAAGNFVVNVSTGGSTRGTVTDSGGVPLSSIYVRVYDTDGYRVASDYSDSDGVYQVDGLRPGSHFVKTHTGSYINEVWDDHPCEGYSCDVTAGDPVAVTADAVTDGIDFALDTGGSITGRVFDADTQAGVQGAYLRAYHADSQDPAGTDYTSSSGEYEIDDLSAGAYFVVVTSTDYGDEAYDDLPCPGGPPHGCDITQANPVAVQLNTTTSSIDLGVDRLGSISGTVTRRGTGDPIPNATVYLYDGSGDSVGTIYASDATYEFSGLEDGEYKVIAGRPSAYLAQMYDGIDCELSACDPLAGTPVVVSDLATVTGIDFDLLMKATISGRVVDATTQQPIQGLRVRAYDSAGHGVDYDDTDASGVYTLAGLDPGTHFVRTDDYEYVDVLYDGIPCAGGCDPTVGTPIPVALGQSISGIDFDLTPRGRIMGTVSSAANGSPLYVDLHLYDSAGRAVGWSTSYGGTYDFTVDDGAYFIAADPGYRHLGELYDGLPCWEGPPTGCDPTSGTLVTASVGTVTDGVDFTLDPMGSISGTVIDAVNGTPIDDGHIYILEIGSDRTWFDWLSYGSYLVDDLYPGWYVIVADGDSHMDEVWDDVQCGGEYPDLCDPAVGTPVQVGIGTSQTADFDLEPLATLSGQVRDRATGAPLSSVWVRAYDAGGEWVKSDLTAGDGSYELLDLWPGTYYLATSSAGPSHVDQLYDDIDCYQGPPDGCDVASGSPIVVSGSPVTGLDFELGRTGAITGRITDGTSGDPLMWVTVEAWDPAGESLAEDTTDSNGFYVLEGLGSASYFVATDEYPSSGGSHVDMLYDGIICVGGPPDGCDPTKGTPVTVTAGQTVRFVDMALPPRETGISGRVVDATTGQPIPGALVDLWDVATGAHVETLATSAAGSWFVEIDPGTYVCSTDNAGGWTNQIFDGIGCPGGSAFYGDCDPQTGDPVVVVDDEVTAGIDFALWPYHVLLIDGFESGDTSGWSHAVP